MGSVDSFLSAKKIQTQPRYVFRGEDPGPPGGASLEHAVELARARIRALVGVPYAPRLYGAVYGLHHLEERYGAWLLREHEPPVPAPGRGYDAPCRERPEELREVLPRDACRPRDLLYSGKIARRLRCHINEPGYRVLGTLAQSEQSSSFFSCQGTVPCID